MKQSSVIQVFLFVAIFAVIACSGSTNDPPDDGGSGGSEHIGDAGNSGSGGVNNPNDAGYGGSVNTGGSNSGGSNSGGSNSGGSNSGGSNSGGLGGMAGNYGGLAGMGGSSSTDPACGSKLHHKNNKPTKVVGWFNSKDGECVVLTAKHGKHTLSDGEYVALRYSEKSCTKPLVAMANSCESLDDESEKCGSDKTVLSVGEEVFPSTVYVNNDGFCEPEPVNVDWRYFLAVEL